MSISSIDIVFRFLVPVFQLKLKMEEKVHDATERTEIGWSQVGGTPITGWEANKRG